MKTTLYPSLTRPNDNRTIDHAWSDIQSVLPRHIIARTKKTAPLFSGVELRPGGQRQDSDVVQVHYGVLDIDGIKESSLVERLPFQYSFLLFSTYSHLDPKDPVKIDGAWRVVVPFSRPVTPQEWPRVWESLASQFGGINNPKKGLHGLVDLKCKALSHAYFVPSTRDLSTVKEAVYDLNEGDLFDVDAALKERPKAPLAVRAATSPATLTLEGFRKACGAQRGPLRKAFLALAKGEAFAPEGERDNTAFQMMKDLAKTIPHVDPESLRPFLAPSIDDMDPDEGFDVDIVIKKFAKAQEDLALDADAEASRDIQYAFMNTRHHGRTEPYTQEELVSFAETLGVSIQDLNRLWVLQKNKSYYILFDGGYRGPFPENEKHAMSLLAPATTAGVARFIPTKNGPKAIGWDDMVARHGTLIDKVMVSLSRDQSFFDVVTRTMYEAPCPRRHLEPVFDKDVDEWCRVFAGKDYDRFIAWLASVPDVSNPTAILFVKGPSGCGKSLLMAALGRLWLRDPWDSPPELMDSMNAEFNEGLLKCPLVVSDESFPSTKSAELRRFMQARSHTLRRKFQSNAVVIGAPRIIIAANNKNMLKLREVLTADDVRAVGERILYLQPLEEARPIAMRHGDRWVHEDTLAKHVLWLYQNLNYNKGSRFLVEGLEGSFHRSLAVGTALSSAVCEWIARYLRDPKKASQCQPPVIVEREDKGLLISPAGLSQYWTLYTTNYDRGSSPELRDISTALQALTHKGREVVKVKGKATHFRKIDMSFLEQWAEDHDWGDLR